MRAALVQRYGSPEVIRIVEQPTPACGPNDVLVEVHASAVTQADRRMRAADYPGITWLPGRLFSGVFAPRHPVPGTTFAGRVAAVGSAVSTWQVGDAVFGESLHGSHADAVRVAADGPLAPIPDGLSFASAAQLPYGAHTAYVFVNEVLRVEASHAVAVIGTGGVGRHAAAFARHLGARVTVVATRRNLSNAAELGPDRVVAADEVNTLADDTFDAVLDTSGSARFGFWKPRLRERGRFASTDLTAYILLASLGTSRSRGRRAIFGMAASNAGRLRSVAQLATQGAFDLRVAQTLDLAELGRAHQMLETARPFGEILVAVR